MSVTSTSKSGDYFGIRTSLVRYDAFDKAGLSVSCKFNVSLEGKCKGVPTCTVGNVVMPRPQ